jgi:hypothetical protein
MHPIVAFYKPFVFAATFFSLYTCFLFISWGSAYFVLTIFWIKVVSSALIGLVFHFSRSEQLHFYHNLGFSTIRLYTLATMLDLLLWIVMITVAAQFL